MTDTTRSLLRRMYIEQEEVAVGGHLTCTYPGAAFNDAIWSCAEPEWFALMRRVRRHLGLKPFRYRDPVNYRSGDAFAALKKLRRSA